MADWVNRLEISAQAFARTCMDYAINPVEF